MSTHSRITGVVRLLVAVWLIFTAVRTLADPQHAAADLFLGPVGWSVEGPSSPGSSLGVLLNLAGLSFTLGVFLLTGFMSRVGGVILVCMGVWEWINLGAGVMPVVLAAIGVYLTLRGGGAWAMDIYVQKVQERARRKEALNSPQSS